MDEPVVINGWSIFEIIFMTVALASVLVQFFPKARDNKILSYLTMNFNKAHGREDYSAPEDRRGVGHRSICGWKRHVTPLSGGLETYICMEKAGHKGEHFWKGESAQVPEEEEPKHPITNRKAAVAAARARQ